MSINRDGKIILGSQDSDLSHIDTGTDIAIVSDQIAKAVDGEFTEENKQTNEQMNNKDKEFLESLIDGNVDLSLDETGAQLEIIGENLSPEIEELFEQAVNKYAEFAITNANSLNG